MLERLTNQQDLDPARAHPTLGLVASKDDVILASCLFVEIIDPLVASEDFGTSFYALRGLCHITQWLDKQGSVKHSSVELFVKLSFFLINSMD